MHIQFSVVGTVERAPALWVDLPSVPREGETVNLPGLSQAETVVRTVVWYPKIDDPEWYSEVDVDEEEDEVVAESFVYVVLGPPRRRTDSPAVPRDRSSVGE